MKRRTFLCAMAGLVLLAGAQIARSADEITVGITLSLSGPYADFGREELNGVQMWVSDVNERGMLLGRQVRLKYYDDHSDPETSARLYEKLISEDKVDLLLGPYSSDITLAASTVAEKHDFPMLATGAAADEIWERGYRNIFGLETPASHYMDLLMTVLAEHHIERIAIVYADANFTRAVMDGVRREAANRKLDIVFDREYPQDSEDFGALIEAAKASRPDILIGGTYFDDAVALVRQSRASDFSPKAFVFTVAPAVPEFGEALGSAAEGMMGVVPWMQSAHLPMGEDFAYRYRHRFGYEPGHHAAYGYGGGQTLEAAVRLAGSLDHDKLREQFRTMRFTSLFGHYRVDQTGKQIGKSTYVMQWQHGRRRLVLPRNLREGEIIYPLTPWSAR
ncbi:MAG TPA: hypothetical protein ENK05_06550 [Gammaproteobacteria bacterium]|nr:hypothetical protein [Gammaproteobacteria bacterium]